MATDSTKRRSREMTSRQRAFAFAVAAGHSASAAYRQAYDARRMSDAAVRVEASRLRNNPNIALTIGRVEAGTRAQAETQMAIDREWVLRRLNVAYEQAVAAQAWGTAVRTLEIMGKALGMFQRRKLVVETVYSLSQLTEAELEARMFQLAERLGYRIVPIKHK